MRAACVNTPLAIFFLITTRSRPGYSGGIDNGRDKGPGLRGVAQYKFTLKKRWQMAGHPYTPRAYYRVRPLCVRGDKKPQPTTNESDFENAYYSIQRYGSRA